MSDAESESESNDEQNKLDEPDAGFTETRSEEQQTDRNHTS
jgi:hypothetical protein